MSPNRRTENFMPVSQNELFQKLSQEGRLGPEDQGKFAELFEMLKSTFHFEFHKQLVELKNTYHHFDPDPTTPVTTESQEPETELTSKFNNAFRELMVKANFSKISNEELDSAFKTSTPLAVNVAVDIDDYTSMELYFRGRKSIKDKVPFLYLFKKEVEMDVYKRLVLLVKFKPQSEKRRKQKTVLGMNIQEEKIYLKYFKNVPVPDIEMIFPDPKLSMSTFDKLKISVPILTALFVGAQQISAVLGGNTSQDILVGLMAVLGGYAVKSIISYRNTVIKYVKNLTQGLYFKNLDNNSGVFHSVMNEAEEEEVKESLLAYYFLLTYGKMDIQTLDRAVEEWFSGNYGKEIDFEIDDALDKLEKLHFVSKDGKGNWSVTSLSKALEALDRQWDHFFDYNKETLSGDTLTNRENNETFLDNNTNN